MIKITPDGKSRWSWVFYDWANSAFATTVMAGFFPLFFKDFYSAGNDPTKTTFWLGVANSVGSLLIALSAPILGSIADAGAFFKRFLLASTIVGALATALLAFVAQGNWGWAAVLYVIASVGFGAAIAFYDSLLPRVSTASNVHKVSAAGYSLGYLGGGILFTVNVLMYKSPATFGLANSNQAIQASFLSVAVWWLLFSVPLFFYVKEDSRLRKPFSAARKIGIKQLVETLKAYRELGNVGVFLLAFFLYNDAVGTTIKMAIDYGRSLNFPAESLVTALLLVQFIGFPSALLFGKITEKLHPKTGIYISIAIYLAAIFFAMQMKKVHEFYYLAGAIGLVQGGIQALSRSYFSLLVPAGKEGQFFGFYNMLGKFTGLLGPTLMGLIAYATGNPRLALIPIMILFIAGAWFLRKVADPSTPK